MKKYFFNYVVIAALAVAAALNSCGKPEDGKDGAPGETGPAGPAGPAGPQGVAGNAGVMMYLYGTKTITTGSTSYAIPITKAVADNSLIYAYYCSEYTISGTTYTMWYPVPNVNTSYETQGSIMYTSSSDVVNYNIYLYSNGTSTLYTTSVTWVRFKIIVVPIPAGNITQMSADKKSGPDFSNYAEVMAYYGLPE